MLLSAEDAEAARAAESRAPAVSFRDDVRKVGGGTCGAKSGGVYYRWGAGLFTNAAPRPPALPFSPSTTSSSI